MEKKIMFSAEGRTTLHFLHIEVQQEIKSVLKQLARREVSGKPLTGQLTGYSTIHVHNHRIIYQESVERIIVNRVGHRKDIYNKKI